VSAQIVPLTTANNQTFSVQLAVNGQSLTLNLGVSYNAMAGYWQMSIADVNGNPLVASVPLVTGEYPAANLLAQYGYLAIGDAYLLNTSDSPADYPGQSNLNQFTLLWTDNGL
jgi:hypothetical protein